MPNEPAVTIALRIPGKWSNPRELMDRLPEGCRLTAEGLLVPGATPVELGALAPDDQFAEIFRSSCREPATEEELATVDDYQANVCLRGPGGSLETARAMMRAAAAIVRAGGAGVFIDNCALAHGGQRWLDMTEDGGSDAVSFAFVAIVSGKQEAWTMGLHVLGLRDVVMKRSEAGEDGEAIIDVIRYLARGDKPIDDRHVIADLNGPRFQAFLTDGNPDVPPGSPMYNPFGRLRLVSLRDIAEAN